MGSPHPPADARKIANQSPHMRIVLKGDTLQEFWFDAFDIDLDHCGAVLICGPAKDLGERASPDRLRGPGMARGDQRTVLPIRGLVQQHCPRLRGDRMVRNDRSPGERYQISRQKVDIITIRFKANDTVLAIPAQEIRARYSDICTDVNKIVYFIFARFIIFSAEYAV
jgi:hypothetical protein